MIEVRGLYKAYGLNLAVRDVSFQANKGEIVGLVGRNGAGKSTTMNIIAGYISSDEGNVWINGHDILKEPLEAKRHLGYMPEFPPLYAEMTVYQYLVFVCKLMGVPKGRIESHLKSILDQIGLEHVKDRLIGNLSKGYRQRVGIAKALCGDPENIILDEPTSGQDYKGCYQIMDIAKQLNAEGHTVIFVTHHMPLVTEYSERTIVMSRKHVLMDGPSHDVFQHAEKLETTNIRPPQITRFGAMLEAEIPVSGTVLSVTELGDELIRLKAAQGA